VGPHGSFLFASVKRKLARMGPQLSFLRPQSFANIGGFHIDRVLGCDF
jgi:hypothetical protein